jgi:hypothetical protein
MSKKLTAPEVSRALSEGMKLTHETWPSDFWMMLDDNGNLVDSQGKPILVGNFNFDGFSIYRPPEKVKMWQWVYRTGKKLPRQSRTYFKSEQQAKNHLYPGELIKRLDYTEVEVEL